MARPWIDRLSALVAPRWTLQRTRARMATTLLERHYQAASTGRRTQSWHRSSGDVNVAVGAGLLRIRDAARDLVRNNPYAESALQTIADHAVGYGIIPTPQPASKQAAELWQAWAGSTDCDADGRCDFAGLQKLVMRTMAESGEVLVRRRFRRPVDGLPIPLQIQVLEPDYLDASKDQQNLNLGGARIVQGVEFDALGRRVAYWLFRDHPGSAYGSFAASQRIPAEGVLHVFRGQRPGQVRAASWFAPVLLRFKDFDEFEDATLMKQKIAACLAVITSDIDGTAPALGTTTSESPELDTLAPGMIANVPPGRTVEVVQPPTVREYADYTTVTLRSIATGLGVTYEDLTGDYSDMPFSAARMSRLRHQARVLDWQWRLLIPQFCEPVWRWAMQAASVAGLMDQPMAQWTCPPMPMVDPDKEGLAYMRNVRSGLMSLSEALRERGYQPDALLAELAGDFQKLDALQLLLDSDPRRMTQAGQAQGVARATETLAQPGERRRWESRLTDFIARLPEERAVDVLAAMFSDEPRAAGNGNGHP